MGVHVAFLSQGERKKKREVKLEMDPDGRRVEAPLQVSAQVRKQYSNPDDGCLG